MCIAAIYFQEFANYPLVIAANRDEYFDRPSRPPGILATKPMIMAGKDLLAGGTWLGINEHGLVAGVLNRSVEKKNWNADTKSRGLLCLDILHLMTPSQVCALLEEQQGSAYQPFNLFFANGKEFYVAYNRAEGIEWVQLQKGVHVLTNTSVYDVRSEKKGRAYSLFSPVAADPGLEPDPSSCVHTLKSVLSDHHNKTSEKDAICVHTSSYGTVSSSIIFYNRAGKQFDFYHTTDAPCREPYKGPATLNIL